MEKILEIIIKNLLNEDTDFEIKKTEENKTIVFNICADKDQIGKIIGRKGRIAQSIRTLIKSLGAKETEKRIVVEFSEK